MEDYTFQISFVDILFLFIGIQGVVLSLILFQKKKTPFSLLGFLTLLIVIDSISHIEIVEDVIFLINHGNLFLFGPLLYVFLISIYDEQHVFRSYLIHFIPFVIIKSVLLIIEVNKIVIDPLTSTYTSYFLALYGLGYSLLSFFYLKKRKSEISKINTKYLLGLVLIFLFGWITSLLARIFVNISSDLENILWKATYFIVGIFFYYITWSLIKNSKILSNKTYTYKHNINEERLKVLLEKDKIYLDASLRSKDLAEKLSISTHELSYLLNQKLKISFNDLLNQYRVKEFKKRLENSTNNNYTFLSLAYESGFGSKASFQRAFKKVARMTPKEYHKKVSKN